MKKQITEIEHKLIRDENKIKIILICCLNNTMDEKKFTECYNFMKHLRIVNCVDEICIHPNDSNIYFKFSSFHAWKIIKNIPKIYEEFKDIKFTFIDTIKCIIYTIIAWLGYK
jgi:hypothetical protein